MTAKGPRVSKKEFKNALYERLKCWKNDEPSCSVIVAGIAETVFDHSSETIDFPCDLTPAERRIVHQLCLRLDLFHASKGEGDQRQVTISKSIDFFESSISQQQEPDADAVDVPNVDLKIDSSIWYDGRAVKPVMKARYFDLSEKEVRKMHEKVDSIQSIDAKVRIKLDDFSLLAEMDSNSSAMLFLGSNEVLTESTSDSSMGENIFVQSTIVDTPDLLRSAGAVLRGCHEIAFDLEMHSFRSYHGLTCLIQLSGGAGYNFLVDPLAPQMWKIIPEVLGPIFSDPRIVKIGHGIMGGDVPALFRDFGIVIINAFDTQEASVSLGRGGLGLASLLDQWGCPSKREIASLKEHMKHTDWRLRPMTPTMLRYAVLDVHYLIPLYKLQVRELLLASVSTGWKEALGVISREDKESARRQKKIIQKKTKKPNSSRKTRNRAREDGAQNEGESMTAVPDLPPPSVVAVHMNDNKAVDEASDDGLEVWGGSAGDDDDDEGVGGEDVDVDVDYNAVALDDDLADFEEEDDDLWDGWGEISAATAVLDDKTSGLETTDKERPSASTRESDPAAPNAEGEWDIARNHLSRSNSCVSSSSGRDQLPSSSVQPLSTNGSGGETDTARTENHHPTAGATSRSAYHKDGEDREDDEEPVPTPAPASRIGSFNTTTCLSCLVSAVIGAEGGLAGDGESTRPGQVLAAILRDYTDEQGAVVLHASAVQSDPRLFELGAALAASQRCCAKLWAPKEVSESAYTKISGFSQRKRFSSSRSGSGRGRWDQRSVYVFSKLFFWRELEAQERDESPAYICPSSLLLDAAEYLPGSLAALSKLQSPLPSSMRTGPTGTDSSPVDLLAALRTALERWEGHLRKLALAGNSVSKSGSNRNSSGDNNSNSTSNRNSTTTTSSSSSNSNNNNNNNNNSSSSNNNNNNNSANSNSNSNKVSKRRSKNGIGSTPSGSAQQGTAGEDAGGESSSLRVGSAVHTIYTERAQLPPTCDEEMKEKDRYEAFTGCIIIVHTHSHT